MPTIAVVAPAGSAAVAAAGMAAVLPTIGMDLGSAGSRFGSAGMAARSTCTPARGERVFEAVVFTGAAAGYGFEDFAVAADDGRRRETGNAVTGVERRFPSEPSLPAGEIKKVMRNVYFSALRLIQPSGGLRGYRSK